MRRPLLSRHLPIWLSLATAGLMAAGCNYASDDSAAVPDGLLQPGRPLSDRTPASSPAAAAVPGPEREGVPAEELTAEKTAILDNVVKLIQTAALNPGGSNFGAAIKNLNQYFEGTSAADYALGPKARAFLETTTFPKERFDDLESRRWSMPDARHVEDCMLYHGIAERVAGVGDDLTRVRRVFDWMVRQIQLVPAGSLAAPQLGQAYARPYDVLLRGMATEEPGVWAERGWLFLSLCRQLGLDGALLYYTEPGGKGPNVWCTGILIDEKAGDVIVPRVYLFDTRIGLAIPDARGDGVATLRDALADPAILGRLDLPGQSAYGTDREALRKSTTKIGVLLDSSPRYFSPRMRLLQRSLAGKNLTILYRDPAEQNDHWTRALGPQAGPVGIWDLPIRVETLLFTDPKFVESTQRSLVMFNPELPLLFARMKQLRGETLDAVQDYVNFRFAENATLMDRKTPMPQEIQKALDVYATYFLGMCQLELKNADKAAFFFEKTLLLLPEYGPSQPYFTMFRRGAQANLARLLEQKGEFARATAYYSTPDPTRQRHGNLLRARDLVWREPAAPPPSPLPPPPPSPLPSSAAAAATPSAALR